jgi:hypothetical protein
MVRRSACWLRAVQSRDEAQTHSGSGSVAVRVRARGRCDGRSQAHRSGGRSAGFLHCVDAGLPGWAGGAVVGDNQAQSTSTDRLPPPRADVPVVPGTAPANVIGLRYLSITQIYELSEGWNCAEIPHANLAAQGPINLAARGPRV